MKIIWIAIGKLKESYLRDGFAEYEKRLTPFVKKMTYVELKEEPFEKNILQNEKERQKILDCEGQRILEKIPENSFVIVLDVHGKNISSEEFAANLKKILASGYSSIAFVIGGTLGISDALRKRADFLLSLSKMTFTHTMTRFLLVEQLYRAFKILNGEKYHW